MQFVFFIENEFELPVLSILYCLILVVTDLELRFVSIQIKLLSLLDGGNNVVRFLKGSSYLGDKDFRRSDILASVLGGPDIVLVIFESLLGT